MAAVDASSSLNKKTEELGSSVLVLLLALWWRTEGDINEALHVAVLTERSTLRVQGLCTRTMSWLKDSAVPYKKERNRCRTD